MSLMIVACTMAQRTVHDLRKAQELTGLKLRTSSMYCDCGVYNGIKGLPKMGCPQLHEGPGSLDKRSSTRKPGIVLLVALPELQRSA